MDFINSVWQLGIIALIAGAMIGILAYRLLSSKEKETDGLKSELDSAREELDEYKASVNQHFDKTSELVNELTQNYVNVYRHLAEGAQTLGDGRTFNNLIEQHPGKVSIAVDDPIEASADIVETPSIDVVATPDKHQTPVDEHAAAFDQVTVESPTQAAEDSDVASADTPVPIDDADSPEEKVEAVLNVEALDQAEQTDDTEIRQDAANAVPEVDEKIDAGTTRH